MIEEIFPDLFKIEIPLPNSVLRAINSYVVIGTERSLMVDTGMARPECKSAVLSSLKKLGVDMKKLDFFITHLHTDHLGLVSELTDSSSKVYFNYKEATMLDFRKHWNETSAFYRSNGFPEEVMQLALEAHPGFKFDRSGSVRFTTIKDGDPINAGQYHFRCIETPGHSIGHTCLYEARKKILLAGDHILQDISPNVSLWEPARNPLKEYLESLDKVANLDVSIILPGHSRTFSNLRQRIAELKQHHRERADEVLHILDGKKMNAFQVAGKMKWDIPDMTWEQFPPGQKWFAMGEALSHLKFIEEEGSARTGKQGDIIVYSAS